jgi:hypothetical protein
MGNTTETSLARSTDDYLTTTTRGPRNDSHFYEEETP